MLQELLQSGSTGQRVRHFPAARLGLKLWVKLWVKLSVKLWGIGLVGLGMTGGLATMPAHAQSSSATSVGRASTPPPVLEATPTRTSLRFLTDNDFPPFHYMDEDGQLTGFNIDLAQAICLELSAACDIQPRPWGELLPALKRRDGNAVIASHAITPALLADFAVSERYFHTPGRFAARRGAQRLDITPEGLEGKRVAVGRGTAHEAYLRSFFRDADVQVLENVELARDALVSGKVDLLFDDGAGLAFWLTGTLSKACCEMVGGGFFEPRFFGDGMAIVMAKGDQPLEDQINQALARIRQGGRYEELLQKHFPVRVF